MNGDTILHGKPLSEWKTLLASTSKSKLIKDTPNFGGASYEEVKAAVAQLDAAAASDDGAGNGLAEDPGAKTDAEKAAEAALAADLASQADEASPVDDTTPPAVDNNAPPAGSDDAPPIADPAEVKPVAVTIDDVFRAIRDVPAPDGYRMRSPTPRLTPAQCELQARLTATLQKLGVAEINSQNKLYPWLLDQIQLSLDGLA